MKTNITLYAYCEPKDVPFETSLGTLPGTPFYVGIGSLSRKLDHLREARKADTERTNILKINKIKSLLNCNIEPIVHTVKDGLTISEAKELEKTLIAELGTIKCVRGVSKRGPLSNLHKGGGGGVGRKKPMSEETKRKISTSRLGHKNSAEHNAAISKGITLTLNAPGMHEKLSTAQRTKTWTEEHSKAASERAKNWVRTPEIRKKISVSNIGNVHTDESKLKISENTIKAMTSPELREQLRTSSKNRWSNPEERSKIGAKNAKSFQLTHRQTGEVKMITNMKAFCREISSDEYWVRKMYEVVRLTLRRERG